ncbi:alanine dehydrogenase [Demequina mangrovi]|uniref:Alanine dehydrogenase n=1 Tax=Demequina mangrovi TaxID=1043493 RepID=A0A1H6X275_9MICO|nr:alanine dehydrogenase [Demequina mangrovi]SEJ21644.1 L-alanine dehydrogenase [Demequina mangrovi]
MIIGVPAETKPGETRIGLAPAGVHALVARGHAVAVEAGAGRRAGIGDDALREAGASLVDADEAWGADLVVKVKEPQSGELRRLGPGMLFTFLHLAADPALADALCAARTTAVSYDTVRLDDGTLPLLAPMSEIAGRLSVLAGAHHLLSPYGGRGVLLGGVPGVPGARVVVIGAGVAGAQAVAQAVGLGADVTVLDVSLPALRRLDARHGGRIRTMTSTGYAVAEAVAGADLVIGAVLVPGREAPRVVTRAMVDSMASGGVLVDIAIDQGGCIEGSVPTTHDDPVRAVGDALVYSVANMPAAVGVTATLALTQATLPYVLRLADAGAAAFDADPALAHGVNVRDGRIVHPAVAQALGAVRGDA